MREYGQFCALARALDVVGDRWTLLIVRELSIRPCRYTDLRDGLPGIATNLLAERLRTLEAAGVVAAEAAPPPVATTLYRLAPRGEELVPVLSALARWGGPFMVAGRAGQAFRPRWMVPAVRAILGGLDVSGLAPVDIVVEVDGQPISVRIDPDQPTDHQVDAELGGDPATADLHLTCGSETTFGVLTGQVDLDGAVGRGEASVRASAEARSTFDALVARSAARFAP